MKFPAEIPAVLSFCSNHFVYSIFLQLKAKMKSDMHMAKSEIKAEAKIDRHALKALKMTSEKKVRLVARCVGVASGHVEWKRESVEVCLSLSFLISSFLQACGRRNHPRRN